MNSRWFIVLGTLAVLAVSGWAGWQSTQQEHASAVGPRDQVPATPISDDDLTRRVVDVFCKQFDCEPARLTPRTDLVRDMKADELDIVEITMALEDAFEIRIPDKEAASLRTVADWVAKVRTKLR